MEDLAELVSNVFGHSVSILAVVGFLYLWKCIKDTREVERQKLMRHARGDYSQEMPSPLLRNAKGRPPI